MQSVSRAYGFCGRRLRVLLTRQPVVCFSLIASGVPRATIAAGAGGPHRAIAHRTTPGATPAPSPLTSRARTLSENILRGTEKKDTFVHVDVPADEASSCAMVNADILRHQLHSYMAENIFRPMKLRQTATERSRTQLRNKDYYHDNNFLLDCFTAIDNIYFHGLLAAFYQWDRPKREMQAFRTITTGVQSNTPEVDDTRERLRLAFSSRFTRTAGQYKWFITKGEPQQPSKYCNKLSISRKVIERAFGKDIQAPLPPSLGAPASFIRMSPFLENLLRGVFLPTSAVTPSAYSPIVVNGTACSSTFDVFLSVLQHECLHCFLQTFVPGLALIKDGTSSQSHGHSKAFRLLALRLFGHSHYKHAIPVGRQEALDTHEQRRATRKQFAHMKKMRKAKASLMKMRKLLHVSTQ